MSRSAPPAVHVAKKMLSLHGTRIHDKAICLTTPIPRLIPLSKVAPSPSLQDFLVAYEPRIANDGLYAHQAEIVRALTRSDVPNVVMTTATGSGKSLAFWGWAFQIMTRSPEATVVAAFPTQALLWGQAKRLAGISEPGSLIEFKGLDGASFAGTIDIRKTRVPWSVWYGTTECEYMKAHEGSAVFSQARLRLCTLDKVHWSLMREKEAEFLSRVAGVILDEAHSWHGLAGANVRAMVDRLRLSLDVLNREHPSLFLASATLAEAAAFAEDLTGAPASSFLEVDDRGSAKASLVASAEVPELLAGPGKPGLLRRYVLLVEPDPEPLSAREILGKKDMLGPKSNALCFVQSKFVGHRLRQELHRTLRDRDVIAYDGDLPPKERRGVEETLFADAGRPKVVVGTSALELGIDLPTLDVVVMDDLPARRCELLQRLGRVGRTAERPGLAILCLGYSPGDERLIEEPLAAVAVDDLKPLPLPLHLDVIRLRAMSAAFGEWMGRLKSRQASWDDFNGALERYFDWAPQFQELKEKTEEMLGDVIDLDERAWYYKGFRVSASQGKRKLVLEGGDPKKDVVATIEDMAVFRDAHPEGVYLGHRGASYRIRRYVGEWDVGRWESPGGVVLGKYMKGLKYIEVTREKPNVATRGRWKDTFTLDERKDLPAGHDMPAKGTLTFGVFTFLRKFDGYQQIDLHSGKKTTVSLADIAERFNSAVEGGEEFPFLHSFSYRTKGWTWLVSRVLDEDTRRSHAPVLAPLIEAFFADAVECSRSDLQVTLDPQAAELRVVDGTPGGNGLSEALLRDGRVATALATAARMVRAQGRKGDEAFRRYLAEECRTDSKLTPKEVVGAIERMADAWKG